GWGRGVRAGEGGGGAPLSFAQERLWFLDQLAPGSAAYNMPVAERLSGPLRPDVLGRCLAEIERRHEVLRTRFAVRQGVPGQVVAPPRQRAGPLVDLAGLPAAARESEAMRLAAAEARRPFDLAAGPLLRAAVLRLAGEEHVLAATMHHIASDGWSLRLLVGELAALYQAFAAGL